jgi:hypothetical protein
MLRLRKAVPGDQRAMEDVQRRASLAYDEYRAQLLAHPDAIAVPIEQIDAGDVFLAERDGAIVGFAAVVLVLTATRNWTRSSSRRNCGSRELDACCSTKQNESPSGAARARCTSSRIPRRSRFTNRAGTQS